MNAAAALDLDAEPLRWPPEELDREPFVVAGCPVRNRAWILQTHLNALASQTRGPERLFYLPNDCEDGTGRRLLEYQQLAVGPLLDFEFFNTGHPGWHRGTRDSGWKDGPHPRYQEDQQANLARARNRWIDRALERYPQATHLWSCDSDVIPDSDVLSLLLAAEKDVVAAVVKNGGGAWNFMLGYRETREGSGGLVSWEGFRTGQEEICVENLRRPFLATLLGACVLIRREVLERLETTDDMWDGSTVHRPRVRFGPHPRGEDFVFCAAAQAAGFELWVEPRARCSHHMEEGQEPLR